MDFSEMSYRALQAECRDRGIKAYGTKADLLAALEASEESLEAAEYCRFIFIGDEDREISVTRYNRHGQPYPDRRVLKADNPPFIRIENNARPPREYTFVLDGEPTEIENTADNRRLIQRLRNGKHFVEVTEQEAKAA